MRSQIRRIRRPLTEEELQNVKVKRFRGESSWNQTTPIQTSNKCPSKKRTETKKVVPIPK